MCVPTIGQLQTQENLFQGAGDVSLFAPVYMETETGTFQKCSTLEPVFGSIVFMPFSDHQNNTVFI